MTALREAAPAKVNLSLHVGPVKANGRHDLISLVCFADTAHDILTAAPAANFSLAVSGPFARGAGPARDNLVLEAARAINKALEDTAPPLAFRLTKNLPCAAGIGGGSSDAAAALRLIVRAHGGDRVSAVAQQVAPILGGDVLACLSGLPGIMSGEGEAYKPIPALPALPALLVNPRIDCPTGQVFAAYDEINEAKHIYPHPDFSGRLKPDKLISRLAAESRNDLEAPAVKAVPEIADVMHELSTQTRVRLVRMSGSGATCFALFDDIGDASTAEARIKETHPDWWTVACMLGSR